MLYTHEFNGTCVKTGDVLFTRDGTPNSIFGALWKLFGHVIPGDLDHCLMYLGPGVRFVESAAKGVVVVEMAGENWDADKYASERWMVDTLVAVSDPTAGRGLTPEQEAQIREGAVAFCLAQAKQGKPYNIDFVDPETDSAFYCSQLVYKAYQSQGINLHLIKPEENIFHQTIVLPLDVWNACLVRKRIQPTEDAAAK